VAELGQSPDEVAARLEEQLRFVEESFTWRARLHAAAVDAVGRLGLELSRDHGWPVADIMDLFVGLSGATTDPAVAQLAIVDLVRSEGAMRALEHATTLADLAETSPVVANALQSYQDLWGQRAVRYELAAPTVVTPPDQHSAMPSLAQATKSSALRVSFTARTRATQERKSVSGAAPRSNPVSSR